MVTLNDKMMVDYIKLDSKSVVPLYRQIVNSILNNISNGNIKIGDRIPSINKLSEEFFLSRDTVERAYTVLKDRKVLVSVQGKGTYVSKTNTALKNNVLFLVNKLSTYKMKIYNAFVNTIGERYQVDLHSYHCDESLFLELLEKHKSNYDYFVIIPHFRTNGLSHSNCTTKVIKAIKDLPSQDLVILDNKIQDIKGYFRAVTQDFENDIKEALNFGKHKILNYKQLILVFPNTNFYPYPSEIKTGFKKYCKENSFNYEIIDEVSAKTKIEAKNIYITLEENDLVNIVNKAKSQKLKLGKDIGVISYNDTPLKQLLGITVLTTDFENMGETSAKMIINKKREQHKTPFQLIIRDSL